MENDKKKVFNKVKHDLEQWREVLVILNSILKWEKSFFPGVIFGVITFAFLTLWWLDFSTLTLIALIIICVTALDFGYPMVSKFIFKSENWSGTQEKLYESIVQEIVDIKLCATSCISSFFNNRTEHSTFYVITVTVVCVFLAWIGSTFNNLFLLYLTALIIAMYPGLHSKGIVTKVFDQIKTVVGPYLKKIRPDKTVTAEKSD